MRKSVRLTPAEMQRIFVEEPAVHQAWLDQVPDKLSEKEFWTNYFRARLMHEHFARTDSSSGSSSGSAEDGTAQAASASEFSLGLGGLASSSSIDAGRANTREKLRGVDPRIDLTATDTLGDMAHDIEATLAASIKRPVSLALEQAKRDSESSKREEMLRSINKSAQHILDQILAQQAEGSGGGSSSQSAESVEQRYHRALEEETALEDLQPVVAPTYNELVIQDLSGYHQGPASAGASIDLSRPEAQQEAAIALQCTLATHAEISHWPSNQRNLTIRLAAMPPTEAASVVSRSLTATAHAFSRASASLAAGTEQLRVFTDTAGDVLVDASTLEYAKGEQLTVRELLRHFYSCFPVTPQTQPKLFRIRDKLEQTHQKLESRCRDWNQTGRSHFVTLLRTIQGHAAQALDEFDRWKEAQQRRSAQQRRPTQSILTAGIASAGGLSTL